MSKSLHITYMTGEYPRISPFIFSNRGMVALRESGIRVDTIGLRVLPESKFLSLEQEAERPTTLVIVPFPGRNLHWLMGG